MEGMFSDLLRSMSYEMFTNIDLYPNAVMGKKIDVLNNKNVNNFFEIEAYFKYYFSAVIRNTIAHGGYTLLFDAEYSYQKLALELIFCLNYFVNTIYDVNELDAMNEYIRTSADNYKKSKEEDTMDSFYNCLYRDFNGSRDSLRKSNYKSGIFKKYEPKQILWWIFNPYYNNYCKFNDEREELQQIIKSPDFWNYVNNKLSSYKNNSILKIDYDKLKSIIKSMFSLLDKNSDARSILITVNKKIQKVNSVLVTRG